MRSGWTMSSMPCIPQGDESDGLSVSARIFDLVHGSTEDGPGLRTVVFLGGCPLRCAWCHNPELQEERASLRGGKPQGPPRLGDRWTAQGVADQILRDVPFYVASSGGVTMSGGEPMLHMPFLRAVSERVRKAGVHFAVDTCGEFDYRTYIRWLRGHVDLFLYDVKLIDDALHRRFTGRSNVRILDNLARLWKDKVCLEVRVPLIPGFTATRDNLRSIADFLHELGIPDATFLPYNPSVLDKWQSLGSEPPSPLPAQPMSLDELAEWRTFFGSCLNKEARPTRE